MNFALIFAGGTGQRMNTKDIPKQFLMVHGKPIIVHTIDFFQQHEEIDGVCVVCVDSHIAYMKGLIEKHRLTKVKWLIAGGATGEISRFNGLQAIAKDFIEDDKAIVLIHDGVRPLISQQIVSDNISSVKQYGSAITCAPVTETIVVMNQESEISHTVDRSLCRLARAPQSFYLKDIYKAYKDAESTDRSSIDSATMMYERGMALHLVEGPIENIKITTPLDYYLMRAIYDARESSVVGEI